MTATLEAAGLPVDIVPVHSQDGGAGQGRIGAGAPSDIEKTRKYRSPGARRILIPVRIPYRKST